MSIIFEEIIIKNIDKKERDENKAKCKNFFSNEMILLSLKAYHTLKHKTSVILKKMFRGSRIQEEKHEYNLKEKFFEDQVCQFVLRILFEDLCLRLQHLKPHDIIRVVGVEAYENHPILNVVHKRNNFYFIGCALRQLISG
jgi:hypothetical protein